MTDNTKLRLRYFPFPGRGGAIRDALRIGGVAFDDAHVPLDRFQARKAAGEFPCGSLPVLDWHRSVAAVRTARLATAG